MNAAVQVREAVRRIGRLSPDWRNPERYFETRSEIERELDVFPVFSSMLNESFPAL